jgi:protein-tyrosine phosphatase
MGISRSSTIVIAYLMSRYGMTYKSALDFVKAIRPQIRPNRYFKQQLQQFEYELYGSYSSIYRGTQSNSNNKKIKKKNKSTPSIPNRATVQKTVRFQK